jgi:hypothetical protein
MEQINFIKEDDDIYALTIFYNYNLYELKISASDLDSDIIEIDYLDEIIQQGLRPNQVKKIDEHLSVKTLIEEDLDQKILKLNIHLVFKKGKLKSTSEKHTLILRQKIIDTQHTFENVMRGTERTLNLPHVQPNTLNLFVHIQYHDHHIHYLDEYNQPINLIHQSEFDYRFLSYLELKFHDVATFYHNKQKSQDSILKFNQDFILHSFHTHNIYALLANYFAYTYFCNFISVIQSAKCIMINVSLNKQPKEAVYHVTEKLTTFNFSTTLHYRILSQFSIGNPNQQEKTCNQVEIAWTGNQGFLLYENRKLAKDKFVYIMQDNYYIKTYPTGAIQAFYQSDKKSFYFGEGNIIKSPSLMLKSAVGSSGECKAIYLDHCGGILNCTCSSITTTPHTRILFQETNCQEAQDTTLYLIEQF